MKSKLIMTIVTTGHDTLGPEPSLGQHWQHSSTLRKQDSRFATKEDKVRTSTYPRKCRDQGCISSIF
ncbi:unnamed protein product [Allacma fusca]|uniref:Uncharacterized protein n=1 Tax=Allacma fusca TaxID=39272 RepID=A0A8J2KGF2_9HEXA|nr:unnamed protein product [Allacma fusca]